MADARVQDVARRGLRDVATRDDDLALTIAVDPGDSDDLACAHREGHVLDSLQAPAVAGGDTFEAEERLARIGRLLRDPEQNVATDHQTSQLVLGGALRRDGFDPPAA